jgi:hypothetical protein
MTIVCKESMPQDWRDEPIVIQAKCPVCKESMVCDSDMYKCPVCKSEYREEFATLSYPLLDKARIAATGTCPDCMGHTHIAEGIVAGESITAITCDSCMFELYLPDDVREIIFN